MAPSEDFQEERPETAEPHPRSRDDDPERRKPGSRRRKVYEDDDEEDRSGDGGISTLIPYTNPKRSLPIISVCSP